MTPEQSALQLHLERVLRAPLPRVFEALTTPRQLAQWWGPSGFAAPGIDLDLRKGGRYRIAMQPPDGELFHLQGEFREVDAPTRLVYTFRWEDPDPEDVETVVTLSLLGEQESTRLIVDQGPFATERRLALHRQGWSESLQRLEALLSATLP